MAFLHVTSLEDVAGPHENQESHGAPPRQPEPHGGTMQSRRSMAPPPCNARFCRGLHVQPPNVGERHVNPLDMALLHVWRLHMGSQWSMPTPHVTLDSGGAPCATTERGGAPCVMVDMVPHPPRKLHGHGRAPCISSSA